MPEHRKKLYPSEDKYFRENPHVTGMAAEDDKVILNPYSGLAETEQKSVIENERARIHMRRNKIKPEFDVTPEQRASFGGSPYENNEGAMKETIAARIYSGDPSAGKYTAEQAAFAAALKSKFRRVKDQLEKGPGE
jgi:hypothetical protein